MNSILDLSIRILSSKGNKTFNAGNTLHPQRCFGVKISTDFQHLPYIAYLKLFQHKKSTNLKPISNNICIGPMLSNQRNKNIFIRTILFLCWTNVNLAFNSQRNKWYEIYIIRYILLSNSHVAHFDVCPTLALRWHPTSTIDPPPQSD